MGYTQTTKVAALLVGALTLTYFGLLVLSGS